jgi:hypothetical protein
MLALVAPVAIERAAPRENAVVLGSERNVPTVVTASVVIEAMIFNKSVYLR